MPNRPSGPIRRAQLIAPFGPGAMVTVPGGTSLMIAGLDYWFQRPGDPEAGIDPSEFKIKEWRLERRMGVGHFRLPPDYRDRSWYRQDVPNTKITIPAFRFPTWHFCPTCHLLQKCSPTQKGIWGKIKCAECKAKGKTRYLYQVPFVAICDRGHIQDFPWSEWVHKSYSPECEGPIRLVSTGASTLAGQKIKCDTCKAERNLFGITTAQPATGSTTLSTSLAEDGEYRCPGSMPWLGPDARENCGAYLKGSLRNAMNVYFAHVRSSIYIPPGEDPADDELLLLLEKPPLSTLLTTLESLGADDNKILVSLRDNHGRRLHAYSDEQLVKCINTLRQHRRGAGGLRSDTPDQNVLIESEETHFRRYEFATLREARYGDALRIRDLGIAAYHPPVSGFFEKVLLVDQLKETRALAGFSRIYPDAAIPVQSLGDSLWDTTPDVLEDRWLPAYQVFGEGILFELDEDNLADWEARDPVAKRLQPLLHREKELEKARQLGGRKLNARFLLVHTLAHLLINQLTFECGYSSASLRERIFVSEDPASPMAGLLIYTADGDSEGTMGGLVRMGSPGILEPVLEKALAEARWCSADPVCMELGGSQGQGPDSTNLAACHNCALVPETACESFNRFLDRGVVVGTPQEPKTGYFTR